MRLAAKKQLAAGVTPPNMRSLKIKRNIASANTLAQSPTNCWPRRREARAPATLKKKRWLLDPLGATSGNARSRISRLPRSSYHFVRSSPWNLALRAPPSLDDRVVFRYAIATARAEIDPTSGLWRPYDAGQMHRAALTDRGAFAGLLRAVWHYNGQPETAAALAHGLSLPRPGELRQAEWA
ncbi:MAG: hypothetical protein R3D02_11280 [Hyphomicrobiales bacterium]